MLQFGLLLTGALLASSVAAAKSWPVQTYQSQNFTAPGFKISRSGAPTSSGSLFLGYTKTSSDLQAPMIFEDTGELVWHGPSGGPIYNFRKQGLNGRTVLTYWTGFLDFQGHGYGNVIILDEHYNQLFNLCLPPSVNNAVVVPRPEQYPGNLKNPCFVDKHESRITQAGTIIITTYNVTQADLTSVGGAKDGWLLDCLFFEMKVETQEILFKWSALEHVKLTDSNFVNKTPGANLLDLPGGTQGTKTLPWDFFHINSVQKLKDGYIVNSRMYWSLFMISNTGKKVWTLEGSNGGDFTLGKGIFFSWQHMPRFIPGPSNANHMQISLFNNDNIPHLANRKNTSTGYLLDLNLQTMHVEALKDLGPATPLFGYAEGSYQALAKDHVLIGYGAVPVVQEFVGNDMIYSAQFARNNGSAHSYRTYRFGWTSQPKTKPSAAASIGGGNSKTVSAFMSWNGATTYDSWNVYAGKTQGKMVRVASNVAKTGFETMKKFKSKKGKKAFKFVMVEALAGSRSLANSSAVRIQL